MAWIRLSPVHIENSVIMMNISPQIDGRFLEFNIELLREQSRIT